MSDKILELLREIRLTVIDIKICGASIHWMFFGESILYMSNCFDKVYSKVSEKRLE